jgi:hypothetical protein
MPGLQSFIDANPVLAVVAALGIGIIVVLAARILLANFSCLARVAVAILIVVAILLLLRFMLAR